MAHPEQQKFCSDIRSRFPALFSWRRVLDIGSLDVNGNNRYLFETCDYTGLDIDHGPNVDIVVVAHEYDAPDESYDVIISTECLEHDPFYRDTLLNAVRLLKPGGLLLLTCATTGRLEHGTLRSDGGAASPLTVRRDLWAGYYMNITVIDIYNILIERDAFERYGCEVNMHCHDLYFWGIKNAR